MIDLLKHIFQLDFKWIFDLFGNYTYLILFVIIFIETGLVLMPFLPGDSLLFTAGLFAHLGYLNLSYLLCLLFIAAVLGDNVNYFIGKSLGQKLLKLTRKNEPLIKAEHVQKTHDFYAQYGTKTIIMARFAPILRTFAPFVAGLANMNYRKFVVFDLIGGILWIGSLTLAGYFLGQFEVVKNNIEKVAILIILVSMLPVLIEVFKKKTTK